jgi:hypothetical protein
MPFVGQKPLEAAYASSADPGPGPDADPDATER